MKITLYMTQVVGRTRGWTQFVSILGYLISLLILVAAGIMIYRGVQEEEFNTAVGLRFFLAGTIVLNALLYLYPAARLWGFSSACQQFLDTRSDIALAQGLREHRQFWKGWGVLTIIMFTLNALVALVIALMGGTAFLLSQ